MADPDLREAIKLDEKALEKAKFAWMNAAGSSMSGFEVRGLEAAITAYLQAISAQGYVVVPPKLTPGLSGILGMMIMQTCPVAHGFRDAGHDIPRKTEAEHAFVLHWLLGLYAKHGDDWQPHAGKELGVVIEKAKAAKAAPTPNKDTD